MNCCFKIHINIIDHGDGNYSAFLFPNEEPLYFIEKSPEKAIIDMVNSKEFEEMIRDAVKIRTRTDKQYLEYLLNEIKKKNRRKAVD